MKTLKLVQAISFALLAAQLSTVSAQNNQQGYGQGPRLQGTCTETDAECNQNSQWQRDQLNQQDQQKGQLCLDNGDCIVSDVSSIALSVEEQQNLVFMREEEKLARDVYTVLYEKWGTPAFANIAMAEQRHIDSVLWIMQQYELEDTTPETVGLFNDTELQDLYNSLIIRASTSQLEALQVGALIEEVDIADLEVALATTENPAIQTLYNNLISGSEKHLRSFVTNIENLGYTYNAQTLETSQVSDILNGDANNTGFAINPSSSQLQTTQAQFRPTISTDKGQYGNQLQVDSEEQLNVDMTIIPDQQHRGQTADIVNVVSYTQNETDSTQMFMQDEQKGWQAWDGGLDTLVAAQSQQKLGQQQQFNVFEGKLNANGRVQINVGYRLTDGTLVFNGVPIEFSISE